MGIEILEIAGSFIVALAASAAIILPFSANDKVLGFFAVADDSRNRLTIRREQLMQSIEALELDFRSGKIEENYFNETRAKLMNEAIECTESLEKEKG